MEGSPQLVEKTGDDDKESRRRKNGIETEGGPRVKKPENLGVLAVERPELEEIPPDDDKKPNFISSLFKRRERDDTEEGLPEAAGNGQTETSRPQAEVHPDIEEGKPKFRFTEQGREGSERPDLKAVPEMPEIPGMPKAKPESIGHMLLTGETGPAAERYPAPTGEASSTEALGRTELLNLAATIEVDGTTLRQIYETHLIGERGLRRLVEEHLRGGDLPKALRHEIMQHEIDFERDPQMRDLAPASEGQAQDNHAALEKLLRSADVSLAEDGERDAFSQIRARHEATHPKRQHSQHYVLDIALAGIISILALLVVFIYVSRS